MSQKIIGTVVLDGLIEGRLPNHPDGAEQLRQWTQFAQSAGLRFALEIEGQSFSLLADNEPLPAAGLGPDVSHTIAAAVGQLLKLFKGDDVRRVMSTLRSVEYEKGREVQTLYALGPGGQVEPKSRTVSAQTIAPEAPVTRKEKIKLALIGLLVALAVFGISTLFFDYRAMFGQVKMSFVPPTAEKVTVDGAAFAEYFTVERKAVDRTLGVLVLTLRRTPHYPGTPAPATRPASAPGAATGPLSRVAATNLGSPPGEGDPTSAVMPTTAPDTGGVIAAERRQLVRQAVLTGYVRGELYDEENRYMGVETIRIKGLEATEYAEVALPTALKNAQGRQYRIARVVLAP